MQAAGLVRESQSMDWARSQVSDVIVRPEGSAGSEGSVARRVTWGYDVGMGQSTQPDPIGLAGGLNLYGYAGGDPINYHDPFGLKITFIGTANQGAMRTLMRGSPTFRAMVVGLQRAPGNIEVRAPQTVLEWSALRGTDFGQGATVKTGENAWAGLINPDASGEHLLRVVAHEVSHLAGVFPEHTDTDAACAKGDKESACADAQTARIWAEVQEYLKSQSGETAKSPPDKEK